MTIAVTSPVTGSAQTGFTSPSFTVATDTYPGGQNGKQYSVTAASGAAGITTSSASSPFTIWFARPVTLKVLSPINPVTGQLRAVPMNVYKAGTRHGVIPLTGQPASVMNITTEASVPAGSDTADAVNVRACLSAHIGALSQQSAGFGDMLVSGSI